MANNLGSLVVSLGLDAAQFTSGMTKAEYQAFKTTEGIKKGFVALSGYLATLSLGTVFVQAIRNATDYADEIGKLAQKAGVGTEALSKLTYAASLSDVSNEQLAKGLRALSKDAADGGKNLAVLGIALTDAGGNAKTADQLLAAVADRFASMPDGIEKTAAAAALFGDKVGPELIPLLNAGAQGLRNMGDEAERFGKVISNDAAKAAEEFNDNLTRLEARMSGLSVTIAGPLVQSVNTMIERFERGSREGSSFLATALQIYRSNVSQFYGGQEVNAYSEARQELDRVNKALESGKLNAMQTTAFMQKQAELSKVMAATLTGQRLGATDPRIVRGGGGSVATVGSTVKPVSIPRGGSGKDPILEANEREAAKLKLLGDLRQKEITVARQFNIEELDALEKRNVEYQKLVQSLVDNTPTAKLEEQRATMALLADEYERGRFGAAGSADAVKLYGETVNAYLGNLASGMQEANATAESAGSIFGSWLERAIADGAKFSDVINGLIRDLALLAIRKAVIEPAAKGFATGAGNLISLFSGFNTYDGGGFTGSGARSGGVDGRGGFPAILHPNETVIDHTKGQGMGGGVAITYQIDARGADPGSEARMRQALKDNAAQTKADIMASMNRGGAWSKAVGRA